MVGVHMCLERFRTGRQTVIRPNHFGTLCASCQAPGMISSMYATDNLPLNNHSPPHRPPMYSLLLSLMRLASNLLPSPIIGRSDHVAYYNPTLRGGSMLIDAGDGYGEPMNVFHPLPYICSH